jgi:muconolactone delta-isomerase
MRYLVIKRYKSVPSDLNAQEMLRVQLDELKYLRDLRDKGKLEAVWKVPGGPGQSVWLVNGLSHEELDLMINNAPDFPHFIFDIRIIPLSSLEAVEDGMRRTLEARRSVPTIASR